MRAKPGELNWAGVTGANSFMFEAWLKANKLDMKKVPYRNAVDAARDLAENRVQVYQSAVAIAQPQIEAGKIKLLAVLNSVRTPAYPNIPTVAEAGHPALTIDGLVGCSARRPCRWRSARRSRPTSKRRWRAIRS